jgi:hypothetical protein
MTSFVENLIIGRVAKELPAVEFIPHLGVLLHLIHKFVDDL